MAADDLMVRVRRHKLAGEVEAIAEACAAAWVGVKAALDAPEHTDPAATAIEALAGRGVTVPSSGVRVDSRGSGLAIDLGVICSLYEGGAGGWFADGQRAGPTALIDACRAGASQPGLAAAATADDWLVRGLGMGFERPVINRQLGLGETLEAGMVLSVADGDRRDVVHVTAEGPVVLSECP